MRPQLAPRTRRSPHILPRQTSGASQARGCSTCVFCALPVGILGMQRWRFPSSTSFRERGIHLRYPPGRIYSTSRVRFAAAVHESGRSSTRRQPWRAGGDSWLCCGGVGWMCAHVPHIGTQRGRGTGVAVVLVGVHDLPPGLAQDVADAGGDAPGPPHAHALSVPRSCSRFLVAKMCAAPARLAWRPSAAWSTWHATTRTLGSVLFGGILSFGGKHFCGICFVGPSLNMPCLQCRVSQCRRLQARQVGIDSTRCCRLAPAIMDALSRSGLGL